jgi:hypothetical protein
MLTSRQVIQYVLRVCGSDLPERCIGAGYSPGLDRYTRVGQGLIVRTFLSK